MGWTPGRRALLKERREYRGVMADLWSANTSYEWFTTYDYQRNYPKNLQISLLNFLCDVNNVSTDEMYILPDVPRNTSHSWNPYLESYMIDSQDPTDCAA